MISAHQQGDQIVFAVFVFFTAHDQGLDGFFDGNAMLLNQSGNGFGVRGVDDVHVLGWRGTLALRSNGFSQFNVGGVVTVG